MTRRISSFLTPLLLAGLAVRALAQAPPPQMLPYTTIDQPKFVVASEATFLLDDDILLGVGHGNVARAYPAADLAQHGGVHDEMPDGPISVTWCGVCNTGVVFRTEVKGRRLHFDYDSMVGANEVHKDRETGSRWQQSTGEAISGPLKGARLKLYPFIRTTWGEWRKQHPDTVVLEPLPGYAEIMPRLSKRMKDPKLREGPAPKGAFAHDDRLRPKEIVAGLDAGGESKAFPFSELRVARVVNDRVGGVPVLVVHQPTSDTTTAFEARANGRVLRFRALDTDPGSLVDLETRSLWDAYGRCLEGPLKGAQLKTLILVPQFWFAWSEFRPQTKVFTASQAQSADMLLWETLMRAPLPEDAEPKVSVFSLPLAPAPPVPRAPGAGHTHAGPVFVYILQGEIENQVEPDPLQIYEAGGFFYEAPMHVHKLLRNRSTTEPARLLAFMAGDTGKAAPGIRMLAQEPLRTTRNQELSLLRLTLPPNGASAARAHSGAGFVYVLEGKIETSDGTNQRKVHGVDELFLEPEEGTGLTFRNTSSSEPARLLLYQVDEKAGSAAREPASAFTLEDSAGKVARLADYEGKVVLLNFWATWCGPCRMEIPWFVEIEKTYGKRGLAVLGVSMDEEGWKVVRPFMEKMHVTYRVLMGDEGVNARYGGNGSLPFTVIVDRDGRIAARHVGLTSKATYEQDVVRLLKP